MYTLRVKDHFDAAHFLPWHEGKCKNLHGHRWEVEVEIESQGLGEGIIVDFAVVKAVLKKTLPDHQILNEASYLYQLTERFPEFTDELMLIADCIGNWLYNPTAENIACKLFTDIQFALHNASLDGDVPVWCTMNRVTVWESPSNSVTYSPEE